MPKEIFESLAEREDPDTWKPTREELESMGFVHRDAWGFWDCYAYCSTRVRYRYTHFTIHYQCSWGASFELKIYPRSRQDLETIFRCLKA